MGSSLGGHLMLLDAFGIVHDCGAIGNEADLEDVIGGAPRAGAASASAPDRGRRRARSRPDRFAPRARRPDPAHPDETAAAVAVEQRRRRGADVALDVR
jgi:hypothetical protein